jgi:hypothetical protein
MKNYTDAELAAQPVGYWTRAANTTVVGYISSRLGELDVTQHHWWTLAHLGQSNKGLTREETIALIERIRPYVDHTKMAPAIDDLLAREMLAPDTEGRLQLTDAGVQLRDHVKALQINSRTHIHAGVDDEDYVTAVKVLRRMIGNVGGDADYD